MKATAQFDAPAFVPPPRTISDVVARLDELAGLKSDTVEGLRIRADALPPPAAGMDEAARFYLARGSAARLLGRHGQGVEDTTKALELSFRLAYEALLILAMTHEELGDYDLAAEYAARAVRAATGGQSIGGNAILTIQLANLGDFEGAEAALSQARSRVPETYQWKGPWAPHVRNLVGIAEGQLKFRQGAYSEAEQIFRARLAAIEDDIANGADGRKVKSRSGMTLEERRLILKTYALRVLGQVLMRQGRLAEAEVVARDALLAQVRHFGRDSGQTVEGLGALSDTLREQGRFEEATTLAKVTLDVFAKMGAERNSVTLAMARRSLADTYVGQSRWTDAMAVYDRIADDLAEDADGLQRILQGNLTWALALIRRGDEAVARLRAISRRLARDLGPGHYATAEAQGLLGGALAAGGGEDAALDAFSQAVPTLLSRSTRSDTGDSTESGRRLRLQFILES